MIILNLLTTARKVNNRLDGAAAFDSTTGHKFVVPSLKRWIFIGGIISRDVSSTVDVVVYDSSDKAMLYLADEAATTGTTVYPNATVTAKSLLVGQPIVLDGGEYISVTFGTAQSTAAALSCVVLEVDV